MQESAIENAEKILLAMLRFIFQTSYHTDVCM